jgi:radical SAM protein with 4Fe4S-binding SPASM domain
MMLTPEEHQRLVARVVRLRAKHPGMRIDTPWDYLAGPPGPPTCTPFKRLGCGQSSLSVTPEGQCYACGQLSTDPRFSVGNVRSSDLAEIWSRSRAVCHVVNTALPRECRSCPYWNRSECFGGCAATSLAVRGALDAGDPYCFVKLAAGGLR